MPANPYFIRGSYTAKSPVASGERTVNFFPSPLEIQNPKGPWLLLPTPGYTQFGNSIASQWFRGSRPDRASQIHLSNTAQPWGLR